MNAIYAHFPFCESRCHYCDFYALGRDRTGKDDPARFERALGMECGLVTGELGPRVDTVFFGGGTPSLTSPGAMAGALRPLDLGARLAPGYEWTIEMNPSSITPAGLQGYRELGANRVSMGVQAMNDDLLRVLGRVHLAGAVETALDAVFSSGIDNVSVDLLCGVPGQTLAQIETAIDRLLRWPISHLSCYLLTLAPHHRMHKDLPGEETQLEHLLFVHDRMTERGFRHYEISNYCRPGRESRHNLNYWKGGGYLGLGPSAHSHDPKAATRWKNVSSLHRYCELLEKGARPVEWKEDLTAEQRSLESWMLALRLDEGVPREWVASGAREARARDLASRGLLEEHPTAPDRVRLTPRGFALSDSVIGHLALVS